MTYEQFKTKWIGKRVDYDGVYGYQCVDLIKQYLAEVHGIKAGAWGDAIKYWSATNPALLKKFDRVATSSAKKGDIVILKPTSTNKYGHIGVANGATNPLTTQILEQNGVGSGTGKGADAIRLWFKPRWRVAGVLRPKAATTSYTIVLKGEGLAAIAKRVGYKDWILPTRWSAIAKLNGSSSWRAFNASLKPGQKIRVK